MQNAEVLADLEGWGQMKRMVAKLCAEIHNVSIIERYIKNADRSSPPPKMVSEVNFLPRRIRILNITKTDSKKNAAKSLQSTVSQVISSMAGF